MFRKRIEISPGMALACQLNQQDGGVCITAVDGRYGAAYTEWGLSPVGENVWVVTAPAARGALDTLTAFPSGEVAAVDRAREGGVQNWLFTALGGGKFSISAWEGTASQGARFVTAGPNRGVGLAAAAPGHAGQAFAVVDLGMAPPYSPPLLPAACPSFAQRLNQIFWYTTDLEVAKAKAMTPQRVVFLGDSITHALETLDLSACRQRCGAVEVYAVPSDKVDDLAWRLCQAFPPTITFVVMIGTNNAGAGENPADKTVALLKYIRARSPTANVFALGIFWRSDPDARALGRASNAAVKAFVEASGDARMVYSDAGVDLPPSVFPDGIHPGQEGWDIVLDKIVPQLAALE